MKPAIAALATDARALAATAPAAAAADTLTALLHSAGGRLTLVGAFTALLAVTNARAWPAVGVVLVLISLLPAHRRLLLTAAALITVWFAPPVDVDQLAALGSARGAQPWVALWPVVVAATLAFGCLYTGLVRRFPKSTVGRRPVLVLLVLLTSLLMAAAHAPLAGFGWFVLTSLTMALGSYVWFFAYAASESRLPRALPAAQQLGYWRPFWGFSNVPLGKGAAYLERIEARDADSLAFAQLSGLRLMVWATVLTLAMDAFRQAVYAPHGDLSGVAFGLLRWLPPDGIPPIAGLLERQVQGNPYPFAVRWAAILAEFVMTVLHMTTWGHAIIATARMAGFQAAANTDRPLLSTSVAEFYNRFYFYFKELLATFFFYPTYLQSFRSYPRVRLFVATVMAAGVGNFLFHFYRDSNEIFRLGFWDALVAYRAYGCYALILGVSIAISQMRLLVNRRRRPKGARRVLAIAGVLFFYCLLNVLDVRSPHDLADYGSLYVSLFVP